MIEFIAGLFVGSWIGIGIMAILTVSSRAEKRAEEMRRKAGLE